MIPLSVATQAGSWLSRKVVWPVAVKLESFAKTAEPFCEGKDEGQQRRAVAAAVAGSGLRRTPLFSVKTSFLASNWSG